MTHPVKVIRVSIEKSYNTGSEMLLNVMFVPLLRALMTRLPKALN